MSLRVLLNISLAGILAVGMASAEMDFENAAAIWLFDDGDGDEVEDISGNDNIGTIMGDFKWVAGKFGGALEFDGASTIVDCGVGESLDFAGQQNFSISVWAISDTNNITTYNSNYIP